MIRKILLFILILISTNGANAQKAPVYDLTYPQLSNSDFMVNVFIDSSNNRCINEISTLHEQFKPTKSRYFFKSIEKTYWFTFSIKNLSSQKAEYVIGFDEVFLKKVDIYYKTDSSWTSKTNGLMLLVDQRDVHNRCPFFHITMLPNETKQIYLRAYTDFALMAGIVVSDVDYFLNEELKTTMWYWAYFGAAIAIFLYNFFLFIYLKEKLYFFYIAYVMCFIVFAFTYAGYTQHLISNIKILYNLDMSIALMGAFVTLFTRELLNTKQLLKSIDRLLVGISLVYFLIALLIPVNIYFYQWLVWFGPPSMFFLFFTGIYSYKKKVKFSGFYILAMSCYLSGLMMIGLVNQGLIAFSSITRYGFIIGSLVELVLFSFALGYRLKFLQDEKNMMQQSLFLSERKQKNELEKQVKERTIELIKTNNHLNRLSKFKDDMTGMIIHDLKNPLNTIMNVLPKEKTDPKFRIIKQSGFVMLNLVQNILDVYKSENAELNLNKTQQSIANIINMALSDVHYLSKQKGVSFEFQAYLSYELKVDLDIIKRVFINLFTNAIKASPNNQKIKIELHYKQKKISVFITNLGKDIPKTRQQEIFKKYKQLDNTEFQSSSTGLGLAFCKMAIEAHNGKIGVKSDSKVGTTFWLTLPNAICSNTEKTTETYFEKKKLALSEEEKKYLSPFMHKLQNLKVYEIWMINKILENIEPNSDGITEWLEELDDAIYADNNEQYIDLLNLNYL
ncbi:MAG: hypothetical protein GQ564_10355 [Bacteroidales bacterium]|nr:hypothetical protein [Bacteroidales bacterium]